MQLTSADANIRSNHKTDVILHAFDWPYDLIRERAKEISELGYKTVLVSPPMKSLKTDSGTQWWQRYQPQDYRVIDNQLGNTVQFKAMVEELKAYDLRVYVDVVFNHMANESSIRDDLEYPNHNDLRDYAKHKAYFDKQKLFGELSQPLFTEDDFEEAFGIEDWKDKWQVQSGRISGGPSDPGLPTLRANANVVKQQQNYLLALKDMGVKGFRIDAAKHMTLEHLELVWTEEITEGVHIFGEIITDGGATAEEYEIFLEPYLNRTRLGAYDFPLFNTVFEAMAEDGSLESLINPYCFGQALSRMRAITFAITHDIPNNDVFMDLVMDEEMEWLAYAYIMGRDGGVPLIYTDLDTSGIKDEAGLPRWKDAWRNPKMVAMIAFHNSVHGEVMESISATEDTLLFSRGEKGYVALNKADKGCVFEVKSEQPLYDCLSGKTYQSLNGMVKVNVDKKSSAMLLSLIT
nr:alpha-amylase family protein [Vibrio maerlii]